MLTPPPRRTPRRNPQASRGPPFRRVHVGRLGLTGPVVHAEISPNGNIRLVTGR